MRRLASTLLLLASDVVAVVLSYVVAYTIRRFIGSHVLAFLTPTLAFDIFVERFYLLMFWVFAFAYEGLYTRRYPFWQEVHRLWRAGLVATLLLTAVMFVTGEPFYLSRIIIFLAMLVSFALLPAFRSLARRLMALLGLWRKKACLIADPGDAQRLKRALEGDRALGYRVVKIMDDWASEREFNGAQALIVQMEKFPGETLSAMVDEAEARGISEVLMAPDLAKMRLSNVTLENLESQVFLKHEEGLLTPGKMKLKTLTDLLLALGFFLLSLPLYPIIALLIKLDSRGPVIFKSKRIGKDGMEFLCYKFRTMFPDADRRLEEFLAENEEARREWDEYSKITNDPRITRVGKFLRKFSLDELPQFVNVLKGDMSLVGPRPYMAWEVAKMEKVMHTILRVKPGITGLWQVSGRNEIDFKNRLLLDEYYVRNWSLWLDLVIILKTFRAVIQARGAY